MLFTARHCYGWPSFSFISRTPFGPFALIKHVCYAFGIVELMRTLYILRWIGGTK